MNVKEFPLKNLGVVLKSILQALLYMKEDHKIYHGNIKLNKILNCNGTIKLSEFLDFKIT